MTEPPQPPPLTRATTFVAACASGLVGGWLLHFFMAAHLLWRTRPSLQPVVQGVGVGLAVVAGVVIAWRALKRYQRGIGHHTLREFLASSLVDEQRGLADDAPEGGAAARLRRHPLLSSAVCVVLAYALTLTLHPPQLEIDDVYWWMFVAGFGMGSAPDEHLWCSHHLVAAAVSALYRTWPDGPWYGLYLQLTVFMSHLAIGYALARRLGPRGLVLFGLQFLAFDQYLAHHLQFTMEAGIAGVGGVLLLALGLSRHEPHPWRHLTAGALLLSLAALIRVEIAFMMLGVFGPVLLLEAAPVDRPRLIRIGAIGLLAAGLLALEVENRRFHRSDPEWSGFHRQYVMLRQELVESEFRRPNIDYTDQTKPVFEEVGWCESDFRLMRRSVYYDDERISDENVERILSRFPRPWRLSPSDYVRQLLETASHPRVVPAFPLALLLLLGLGRRGWIALGAAAFVWLGALFYFLNFAKPPPDRVYLPVVAGALWACAFLARRDVLPPQRPLFGRWPRTTLRQALVGAALVVGAMNLNALWRDGQRTRERAVELRAAIERLAPRPDQLYVIFGGEFPYDSILPFEDVGFIRPMRSLGTLHNSGFNKRRMREFDITDVYTALYERPDVLLVSTDELNSWLAESVRRHHGVELVFERVFEGPEFEVYDVSPRGT